jgi:hypothetical protein
MDFAFGGMTYWSITWLGPSIAEVNRTIPETKALKKNYAFIAMFDISGFVAV